MTSIKAIETEVEALDVTELKRRWSQAWGLKVPSKISQKMMRRSLIHKLKEQAGFGLSPEDQIKLKELVEEYKKNKSRLMKKAPGIKPGTRLVRTWQGKKHIVVVTEQGFEYEGQEYGSLSKIANLITGTKWNGLVFFGIKKKAGKLDSKDAGISPTEEASS